MAEKPIVIMGDPRLLQRSAEVTEFDTPALHATIQDMLDTMEALSGAGLAAPQIGILQRIVIFGNDENPRYPDSDHIPLTILINPTIELLTTDTDDMWEGCLSIPNMRGLVSRPIKIRYQGFDQYGNTIDREVSDFHARVVQHECDHLDGILYPMRIKDIRMFGFEDALFAE